MLDGCSLSSENTFGDKDTFVGKSIDLFYEENKNEEIFELFERVDATQLNPIELTVKQLITVAALCESGKYKEARVAFDSITDKFIKKNFCLLFLYKSIEGLLLFRENKNNEAYTALMSTNSETCDFRVQGLNQRIIARIAMSANDYKQALEYFLESSLLFEKAGKMKSIAINEKMIGRCYMLLENQEEAIIHFRKAEKELLKFNDQAELFYIYTNILDYALKKSDSGEAEIYALKCQKIIGYGGATNDMLILTYNNLGEIALVIRNYSNARSYFEKAIVYCDSSKALRSKTVSLNGLSKIEKAMGRNKEAYHYARNALKLAHQTGSQQLCYQACKQLVDVVQDYDKKLALAYKDSMIGYREAALRYNSDVYKAFFNTRSSLAKAEAELLLRERKQQLIIRIATIVCIAILLISILLFRLYLNRRRRKEHALMSLGIKNDDSVQLKPDENQRNTKRNRITDEQAKEWFMRVTQLFDNQKNYTDPSLNIDKLAKQLNTNRDYLSQAINRVTGKDFTDFVNEFRIAEAKSIIAWQISQHGKLKETMAVIAQASGFKNTSTFNPIFKQATGLTPSEYARSCRKISGLPNP